MEPGHNRQDVRHALQVDLCYLERQMKEIVVKRQMDKPIEQRTRFTISSRPC
jgi:hypothetical protein